MKMIVATAGIDPSSPLGILIISIGIVFTIGLPLLMILKGKS
tara:strand:+ start:452 stop:577 length:126 start_codon:yes stop_codon:yes gene_type:complete